MLKWESTTMIYSFLWFFSCNFSDKWEINFNILHIVSGFYLSLFIISVKSEAPMRPHFKIS